MEEDTQKKIEARLAELPQDIQEAVLSAELGSRIQTIGAMHQLHVDQVGTLEEEVMLTMLGFSNPATFAEQLMEELHTTPELAAQIAQDVTQSVFLPIRESMQSFMTAHPEGKSEEKTSAPLQKPDLSTLEILAPKQLPELPQAEVALSQTTSVSAPQPINGEQQKPRGYSADPYREPPE